MANVDGTSGNWCPYRDKSEMRKVKDKALLVSRLPSHVLLLFKKIYKMFLYEVYFSIKFISHFGSVFFIDGSTF